MLVLLNGLLRPLIQRKWTAMVAGGQALLEGAGGDLVDERGTPIEWTGIDASGEGRDGYVGARSLDLARAVAGRFFVSSSRRGG